jgi:hypothetical protein
MCYGALMNFYKVDPQSDLHQDIPYFWSLEESRSLYNSDAVIPDSTVEFVINCGAPLTWYGKHGISIELPRVFIKGLQRKPLKLRVAGETAQLVGVSLNAWAVSLLPDVPLSDTGDSIIPLGGVWQDFARTIPAP